MRSNNSVARPSKELPAEAIWTGLGREATLATAHSPMSVSMCVSSLCFHPSSLIPNDHIWLWSSPTFYTKNHFPAFLHNNIHNSQWYLFQSLLYVETLINVAKENGKSHVVFTCEQANWHVTLFWDVLMGWVVYILGAFSYNLITVMISIIEQSCSPPP